jgi:hypothetical protein
MKGCGGDTFSEVQANGVNGQSEATSEMGTPSALTAEEIVFPSDISISPGRSEARHVARPGGGG